jgi:hypothetical protein
LIDQLDKFNNMPGLNLTLDLLKIIGSPFHDKKSYKSSIDIQHLSSLYELSFENRIELLFLHALRDNNLLEEFEDKLIEMEKRCITTRRIAAQTSHILSEAGIKHAVFKSIKPYPATPNDTDVVCFGKEREYQKGLKALTDSSYVIQAYAPMQTLLYHPWGEGKVGPGKKGGTYYVDFYRGVAVDHYEYVNKSALAEYCIERVVDGEKTVLLAAEPELSIVMFHNVFPEKTFQLEHFYLCLYGMANPDFDLAAFIAFTEQNAMVMAVRSNLTIIELLHEKVFGTVPDAIRELMKRWGREQSVIELLKEYDYRITFIFPASLFWKVFLHKQKDPFSRRSLAHQCFHMLNPIFFWDAFRSAWKRTFEKDHYVHQ